MSTDTPPNNDAPTPAPVGADAPRKKAAPRKRAPKATPATDVPAAEAQTDSPATSPPESGTTSKKKRASRAKKPAADATPVDAASNETSAANTSAELAETKAKRTRTPRTKKTDNPTTTSEPRPEEAPNRAQSEPTHAAPPSDRPQEQDRSQASGSTHHEEGSSDQTPVRRSYPVYVPLNVARQLEQQGQSIPVAVAPHTDAAEKVRALTESEARAAQPAPPPLTHEQTASPARAPLSQDLRPERDPRFRDDRDDRGGRNRRDHNDRNDRRDRHGRRGRDDRRDRNDRHERLDRGDRTERMDRNPEDRGERPELPPPTPEELSPFDGIIEVSGKGFGFLRDSRSNFMQHPQDVYVPPDLVRKYCLKDGHQLQGVARRSGRGQQVHELQSVNGLPPEQIRTLPTFDELTVINPMEMIRMETSPERYTTRIIDMICPVGKGQRGLIVAPPRAGKTTFLQHIADSVVKNHPDIKLILLLIDERPEEVTEFRATIPSAEIMASSNDMDVRSHTRIAELAIERAKRHVEAGHDVFILLDSITRLGRAYNNAMTNGGRTMSGGVDARALETPRKLFAAARNTEEAGSLTILATALVETGSRMDELIFLEFKGTGNMELVLDRKIAEQRIYPAVDIFQSGTRREELLIPADELARINVLRRGLSGSRPLDAIDRLLSYIRRFPVNEQLLKEIRG
jgi:transcription termination factor Rho